MTSNPFLRYLLSPLVVLASIGTVDLLSHKYEWLTLSLALPVGLMALCLFWAGLRANVASALILSTYAIYNGLYSPEYDLSRAVQVVAVAWPVAVVGGLLKRWLIDAARETERQRLRAAENQSKADFVDTLNGNIQTIKEVNSELIELSNAVPVLSKSDILTIINRIQGKAANLAQRVVGWHQLAQEKKSYLAEKEGPSQQDHL